MFPGNGHHFEKHENTVSDSAMVCFLSLIVLLFFSPLLVGDKTLYFRDILVFSRPMKYFLYRAYHEKFFPFWDPQIFSGTPFLASLQSCVFYPPSLIFFLEDFNQAFNIFFVFHPLLLALSVYALIRYWGLSVWAGVCSALTALFGGYFLSLSSTLNHYQSAAWLPLVFLISQKYQVEGGARNFTAGVACWACQILAGSPEVCIMTAILVFSHTMALLPREKGFRDLSTQIVSLGTMIVMAFSLTAAQLLPTYLFIKESVRSGATDFSAHAAWSLSPSAIGNLLLPENFLGFMERLESAQLPFNLSGYMGLTGALSLLLVKQRSARYWFIVFLAGLFFALGKYNPLYVWMYTWIPGLGLFRFPEKYFLVSAFSLVFLVGYACDVLLAEKNGLLNKRLLPAAAFLLALMTGLLFIFPERKVFFMTGLLWLSAFCFSCHYHSFSGKKLAKYLLVLLILLDLAPKNYPLVPMIEKSFYTETPLALKTAPAKSRIYSGTLMDNPDKNIFPLQPTLELQHLAARERLRPNLGTTYGVSYADGLVGVESNENWLWSEIFKLSSPDKRLLILKRSNVGFMISGNESSLPASLQALNDVLPRAFLTPKWRLGEEPKLLNYYYAESFDPRQEVLLSEPAEVNETAAFEGKVEIIRDEANHVALRTIQNGDGFLVLLDSWFPGWTATVDGKPENIFRANHFYRAVKTGSGTHTVEFSFEPPGFHVGRLISGATLCVLTAIIFMEFRKKKPS